MNLRRISGRLKRSLSFGLSHVNDFWSIPTFISPLIHKHCSIPESQIYPFYHRNVLMEYNVILVTVSYFQFHGIFVAVLCCNWVQLSSLLFSKNPLISSFQAFLFLSIKTWSNAGYFTSFRDEQIRLPWFLHHLILPFLVHGFD